MPRSIGILTFEQMRSRAEIGSTRIRARWLTKYWPDAELFKIGNHYSVVIFQKAYWVEYAASFGGIKILDLCDPDLLDWKSRCLSMANHCDAIVTSTEALACLVSQYTSIRTVCIPDRIDLDYVARYKRKDHSGRGRAQTAAWYGYSMNYPSLDVAVPDLVHFGFTRLIVISDDLSQYRIPAELARYIEVIKYAWNNDTVCDLLTEADVIVNYRLDFGRWRYKSNNKTTLAWALGMPVAHSAAELAELISETSRKTEAEHRLAEVESDYDIRRSVDEYGALISSIESGREGAAVDGIVGPLHADNFN